MISGIQEDAGGGLQGVMRMHVEDFVKSGRQIYGLLHHLMEAVGGYS